MKDNEKAGFAGVAVILFVYIAIISFICATNTKEISQLEQQLESMQQVQNDTQDEIKLLESRIILLLNEKTAILDEIKAYEITPLEYSLINENYSGIYRVTAYNLDKRCCGKEPSDVGYGITASGEPVKAWHTIAVSPDIPFGTKIYIPEFKDEENGGIFTAADWGYGIDEWCFDVYYDKTYKECLEIGEKYLQCYVLQ